ncbi:hypothetical protein V2J09_006604 [Rumex salicifolius]
MVPKSLFFFVVVLILYFTALFAPLTAMSTCATQSHLPSNKVYDSCADLPTLNSRLHWTYSPAKSTLDVAFLSPLPSSAGWVSWAINPTGTGMAGAQALIGFQNEADGSMAVKTYNIASYSSIVEGNLDLVKVLDKSAEYSDGMMEIYATVSLPATLSSSGKINHLWQVGPSFAGSFPGSRNNERHKLGILFPMGVMIARYLKTVESADPAWFYLHISCQMLGYILGVAGWATGLAIGSHTEGIVYSAHRSIGIALFCFATNQILAMGLRPKKESEYRLWWTVYHRSVGYATVVLGIVNVFGGLKMLQAGKKWTLAYAVVLVMLGCVSVVLEGVKWAVRSQRTNQPTNRLPT